MDANSEPRSQEVSHFHFLLLYSCPCYKKSMIQVLPAGPRRMNRSGPNLKSESNPTEFRLDQPTPRQSTDTLVRMQECFKLLRFGLVR